MTVTVTKKLNKKLEAVKCEILARYQSGTIDYDSHIRVLELLQDARQNRVSNVRGLDVFDNDNCKCTDSILTSVKADLKQPKMSSFNSGSTSVNAERAASKASKEGLGLETGNIAGSALGSFSDTITIEDENELPSPRIDLEATDHSNHEQAPFIKSGYLFPICFRCMNNVLIVYGSGSVRLVRGPSHNECQNGILFTICKSCSHPSYHGSRATSAEENNECAAAFITSRINPQMFSGMPLKKIASTVVGTEVPVVEHKGLIVFMDRNAIMDTTTKEDKIMRLDVERIHEGEKGETVFLHLNGGFF